MQKLYTPLEDIYEPFRMMSVAKTMAEMETLRSYFIALARQHPAYLAPLFFRDDYGHPMVPRPFHFEWLNHILNEDEKQLLILAARGHAKSVYISQVLPPWLLGHNPRLRVQLQAVNDDLAKRFTRQLIRVLKHPLFRVIFPECPAVVKSNEHMIYLTEDERDPSFMAQGWESGVTGYRADVILYEDLVTREIAQSETQRRKQIEWHKETMRPILTPGGRIICTGTPYHEEDLWNYCEQEGNFNVIRYPACDSGFANILWPERFTEEFLQGIAKEVGSAAFTTQYLCESASSSGEVFKKDWFTIAHELPRNGERLLIKEAWWTWDTAISAKTNADNTAGILGGIATDGKAYVLDMVCGKWEPSRTRQEIVGAFRASKRMYGDIVQGVLIEDTKEARVWKSWIDEDVNCRDIPVILCPHEGLDKFARAARVVPKCEAGNVVLYAGAWNSELLAELTKFTPDGRHAHDDKVDAFAYLISRLFNLFNKKTNDNLAMPSRFFGGGGARPNFI